MCVYIYIHIRDSLKKAKDLEKTCMGEWTEIVTTLSVKRKTNRKP